uniref:WW domain-containing protein n=1 Tax=Panagrellus redivivus TaxID=6233 RepID=A0A7E4W9Y0_PANRE
MIWEVQKRVIWLLGLLAIASAQNACSFSNGAYNLNWNVDSNNNVNYVLNYNNFPTNGNYWIAFSYDGFNSVLISGVNGQVQIQTANIQNSQPLPTVGSNILQSQSGSLNNGNLQANFVIPLAALNAAAGGATCMQWQFYTTATQSGSSYPGSPQTQQVCNLQQQCGQGTTYAPDQYGNGYGPNYDSSLMGGSNRGFQSSTAAPMGYQSSAPVMSTGYQSSTMNTGYQSTTPYPNTGYQSSTPYSSNYQSTTQSPYGYQATTQSPNMGYQSTMSPQYDQSQSTGTPNVGYTGPPYTGGAVVYNTQQNAAPSGSYNNQQQYSQSSSGYNNQQYSATSNAPSGGQTFTSTPYPAGYNSYSQQQQQQQYSSNSNTRFNDANSPSQNGEALGFPTTNGDSFVVANPNYIFLPPAIEQRFLDNELGGSNNGGQGGGGSGSGVFYDQNSNVGGQGLYGSTTTQAPVLSNDAQNQANYQRIQADPPTTADPSTYTNNIYGYDYRSNANMQYTLNGNPSQYQPPSFTRFQPPPGSPFRKKRQAFTQFTDPNTLPGTAYYGQNSKVSSSSANTIFYDSNQQSNLQSNTPATPPSNQYQYQQQQQTQTQVPSLQQQIQDDMPPAAPQPTAEQMYQYEQRQQLRNKFYYWNPTGFTQWDDSNVYVNTDLAEELSRTTTTTENPFYPYVNRPYENSKYDPEANVITGTIPAYLPYRTLAAGQGSATYLDTGSAGTGSSSSTYNTGTAGSTSGGGYTSYSSGSTGNTIYRDNVVNPQSPNYPQVVQQDQQAMQAYTDQNCSGTDPYWCQNYVSQFMLWQTQFDAPGSSGNNAPNNSVCQALAQSLQYSEHRCCQTVRQAGCRG